MQSYCVNGPQDRVATAQENQGIWMLTFPDRENTGNLVNLIFTQGKLWQHRENLDFFLKSLLSNWQPGDEAFLC